MTSLWSPSLTYQPPSGSDAEVPDRTDGPRLNSGMTVASRPTEPQKASSSSGSHTLTEASTRSAITASRRFLLMAISACESFFRIESSSDCEMTRFFTSIDGSITDMARWNR